MKLNDEELARLVKSQRDRIYDLIAERDEARGIARQLLFELRERIKTPATHAGFWWLKSEKPEPGITEEKARDQCTEP